MSFLQKLHAKPEAYRQNLALGITVALSAIIFVLWLMTLPGRLAAIQGDTSMTEGLASAGTPFGNISDNISSVFGDAKTEMQGLLKVINK